MIQNDEHGMNIDKFLCLFVSGMSFSVSCLYLLIFVKRSCRSIIFPSFKRLMFLSPLKRSFGSQ